MSIDMLVGHSSRIEKAVPTTVMALAFHAAGHAVANIVQGLDLHPVSVPLDGVHNGVVVDHVRVGELRAPHRLNADTFVLHRQNLLEKKVRSYLAGRFAQRRFSPRSWRSRHDSGDQQRAMEMLLSASDGSERTAIAWMRLLSIQTEDLVDESWSAVEAVANALASRRVLLASDARALCWQALDRAQ
jgi:hypothetical protein